MRGDKLGTHCWVWDNDECCDGSKGTNMVADDRKSQNITNQTVSSCPICVAVASHKPYRMPKDPMYMPLQVGKALHPEVDLGFQNDATGKNISFLNASYSELTALYWLWKNCNAEYKGLTHYRRHFASLHAHHDFGDKFERIIGVEETKQLLKSVDIIVPRKRVYYIETMYSHYIHTFSSEHLDVTRHVIEESQSRYLTAFDEVMQSRSAHMFNMFIMKQDKFDEYCSWLFPILEEMSKHIDSSQYDAFNARYPGRISELLLDVWLKTKKYRYNELPVMSTEPVNWWKKGTGFLLAKWVGRKYSASF